MLGGRIFFKSDEKHCFSCSFFGRDEEDEENKNPTVSRTDERDGEGWMSIIILFLA